MTIFCLVFYYIILFSIGLWYQCKNSNANYRPKNKDTAKKKLQIYHSNRSKETDNLFLFIFSKKKKKKKKKETIDNILPGMKLRASWAEYLATLTAKGRILERVSSVGQCWLSTSPALTLTAEVRSDAFRFSETAVPEM